MRFWKGVSLLLLYFSRNVGAGQNSNVMQDSASSNAICLDSPYSNLLSTLGELPVCTLKEFSEQYLDGEVYSSPVKLTEVEQVICDQLETSISDKFLPEILEQFKNFMPELPDSESTLLASAWASVFHKTILEQHPDHNVTPALILKVSEEIRKKYVEEPLDAIKYYYPTDSCLTSDGRVLELGKCKSDRLPISYEGGLIYFNQNDLNSKNLKERIHDFCRTRDESSDKYLTEELYQRVLQIATDKQKTQINKISQIKNMLEEYSYSTLPKAKQNEFKSSLAKSIGKLVGILSDRVTNPAQQQPQIDIIKFSLEIHFKNLREQYAKNMPNHVNTIFQKMKKKHENSPSLKTPYENIEKGIKIVRQKPLIAAMLRVISSQKGFLYIPTEQYLENVSISDLKKSYHITPEIPEFVKDGALYIQDISKGAYNSMFYDTFVTSASAQASSLCSLAKDQLFYYTIKSFVRMDNMDRRSPYKYEYLLKAIYNNQAYPMTQPELWENFIKLSEPIVKQATRKPREIEIVYPRKVVKKNKLKEGDLRPVYDLSTGNINYNIEVVSIFNMAGTDNQIVVWKFPPIPAGTHEFATLLGSILHKTSETLGDFMAQDRKKKDDVTRTNSIISLYSAFTTLRTQCPSLVELIYPKLCTALDRMDNAILDQSFSYLKANIQADTDKAITLDFAKMFSGSKESPSLAPR